MLHDPYDHDPPPPPAYELAVLLPVDILLDICELLLPTVLLFLLKVLHTQRLQLLLLSQQSVPGHCLLPLPARCQFRQGLAPLVLVVLLGLGQGDNLALQLSLTDREKREQRKEGWRG